MAVCRRGSRLSETQGELTMKNLCTLLVLLVVAVGVVGFFRNWYHLSSESTDTTVRFNLTVDKEKLQADKESAQEQIQEAGRKLQQKALDITGKGKNETTEAVEHPSDMKPVP